MVVEVIERLPGLVRAVAVLLRTAFGAGGATGTVAWAAAGALLLVFGLVVTRLLPLHSKGETP